MRTSEKELILKYFDSQITALEYEVSQLQTRVRYRRIDVNDSYELQNALVRYETMMQVCKDITTFLRLGDDNKPAP